MVMRMEQVPMLGGVNTRAEIGGEEMNDGIRVTENDVIGIKSAVWR